MYIMRAELGSVDMKADPEYAKRTISRFLGALTATNADYLRTDDKFPLLYYSGVRYYHDKVVDPWRDCVATNKARVGDCDNLSCWRAAELQVRFGVMAIPAWYHKVKDDGSDLFHIVVQYPNGDIEDPSIALGMRKL